MPKTILVTGGAGYIGSACVDLLHQTGHKLVVLDNLSSGQPDKLPKEVDFISGDITNILEIKSVCQKYQFDTVIHCAAKKAVGESELDPSLYFYNNVVGSLNVLATMEEFQIPQIIFSSTAAVYEPSPEGLPVEEDATLNPVNVYGRTKLMVEAMIKDYARLGKIKSYTIFRYFNVAGDAGLNYQERNAQNVFPLLARAVTTEGEFLIFGTDFDTPDGTGVSDYMHLLDLVEAHSLALEKEINGVFNLGTGKGYSVRELVEAFSKVAGKDMNARESCQEAWRPSDTDGGCF
ncbi:MAG: UDP-glucose 4-epimerase GalE [Candidatus Paceibacterota bacterium]